MINKFSRQLKSLGAAVSAGLLYPLSALAVLKGDSDPTDLTENIDDKYKGLAALKPSGYLKAGVNFLLMIAGIISFFFLLWGGIQWILAGGDKEGTEKARKRITSALIGLAIVFSAYALLFIISALFGIELLNFSIPKLG